MSDYSLSDIAAVADGGGNGNGWGMGNGWWIILLFILLGGWGGNRAWGNQGAGSASGDVLYPWLNQAQGQWQGFADVQQSLCNGFAGVTAAVTGGFAGAEAAAAARQVADMQQAFAAQTAMMQGFNAQQAQLAQCCCDNRLATANLQSVIAQENCADRQAVSDGIRDLLVNNNANTQRIIDQMCQDKIAAKDDLIAQLRSELMYSRGQASQDIQTAAIQAGQRALANEVEQYVLPTPRPAYIVQNPNCCQPSMCGCGA